MYARVYVVPFGRPAAKRAQPVSCLFSAIASAPATSGRNFFPFVSLLFLPAVLLLDYFVDRFSFPSATSAISGRLSLRIRRKAAGQRQMAAERVTEARVTNVCRYARRYGARKLLVSMRLDPPAILPPPPSRPDARRRDGSTRVPFAHKVGKKPGTLTQRSPVTLGPFFALSG